MQSNKILSVDNHLYQLARLGSLRLPKSTSERTRRKLDRIVYPIAVAAFGLMTPILASMALLPFLLVLWVMQGDEALMEAIANSSDSALFLILGFGPIYLIVWLWLLIFEKRQLWTTGLEWPRWLSKYFRGLLVGLLMFGTSVGILSIFGFITREPTNGGNQGSGLIFASLAIIVGWMVQSGAEELLARGFILPIIGARFGTIVGILVSSTLFMALHLLNPNLSIIGLLNLFLFAVFAAVFALYEGGLWGVFAIHAVWNWAQGNLFGFEVSGSEVSTAVIFNLAETGPDWVTGGSFGPEGGVVVTTVLLVSTVIVLFAARSRPEPASGQDPNTS